MRDHRWRSPRARPATRPGSGWCPASRRRDRSGSRSEPGWSCSRNRPPGRCPSSDRRRHSPRARRWACPNPTHRGSLRGRSPHRWPRSPPGRRRRGLPNRRSRRPTPHRGPRVPSPTGCGSGTPPPGPTSPSGATGLPFAPASLGWRHRPPPPRSRSAAEIEAARNRSSTSLSSLIGDLPIEEGGRRIWPGHCG